MKIIFILILMRLMWDREVIEQRLRTIGERHSRQGVPCGASPEVRDNRAAVRLCCGSAPNSSVEFDQVIRRALRSLFRGKLGLRARRASSRACGCYAKRRTRGAGSAAHRRRRPRGSSMWSLTVMTPRVQHTSAASGIVGPCGVERRRREQLFARGEWITCSAP